VLQVSLWEKLSVYDQIVILKNEKDFKQTILHEFLWRWFTDKIHSLIKTKLCKRERLFYLHYMTYIA